MQESLREMLRIGVKGRTVAVLGDMGELDEFSEEEHGNIGRLIAGTGIDVFIGVGPMMSAAAEECMRIRGKKNGSVIHTFRDADEAKQNIMDILKDDDTVLINRITSYNVCYTKLLRSLKV